MLRNQGDKKFIAVLVALVLGFSFMMPSVYAKGHGRSESNSPGPGSEPSGWDQGKKKGWNGGDEPPGLAKKKKKKTEKRKSTRQRKNNASLKASALRIKLGKPRAPTGIPVGAFVNYG